jgi:hypothetical protein
MLMSTSSERGSKQDWLATRTKRAGFQTQKVSKSSRSACWLSVHIMTDSGLALLLPMSGATGGGIDQQLG